MTINLVPNTCSTDCLPMIIRTAIPNSMAQSCRDGSMHFQRNDITVVILFVA